MGSSSSSSSSSNIIIIISSSSSSSNSSSSICSWVLCLFLFEIQSPHLRAEAAARSRWRPRGGSVRADVVSTFAVLSLYYVQIYKHVVLYELSIVLSLLMLYADLVLLSSSPCACRRFQSRRDRLTSPAVSANARASRCCAMLLPPTADDRRHTRQTAAKQLLASRWDTTKGRWSGVQGCGIWGFGVW